MKRLLPWALTLALIACAWVVAFVTPADRMALDPFPLTTQIGEEVVGRDFALTVKDIRAAESVTTSEGWQATGTWLLIDLDAEGTQKQEGTLLNGAALTIGDRTFRASERMPSMFQHPLVPGIPYRGTVAFELPEDALQGNGILHLSTRSDDRGDSVAELAIDLGALEVEPEAQIADTEWGAQ